mmetsp:Transcript_23272/g.26403  ORF Transcript_23272/g.26403 Transcript_23272/m.26403 type:complete len:96 (+) Transcript_23272:99-386(+)
MLPLDIALPAFTLLVSHSSTQFDRDVLDNLFLFRLPCRTLFMNALCDIRDFIDGRMAGIPTKGGSNSSKKSSGLLLTVSELIEQKNENSQVRHLE